MNMVRKHFLKWNMSKFNNKISPCDKLVRTNTFTSKTSSMDHTMYLGYSGFFHKYNEPPRYND